MSAQSAAAAQIDPRESRAMERDILTRVTSALEESHQKGDTAGINKAASDIQLLWSIFVRDLQSDQNQLPAELRKQLVEIGQTVIREISENLNKNLDVDFILSINRSIIEGLAEQG